MFEEEKEVIKQYFKILSKNHPEKFEIEEMFDDDGEPIVPENMKDSNDTICCDLIKKKNIKLECRW
ncbi:MAG: hypothetical protein ACREV6_15850 [Clostridium sp.]|uniref:hypothetical protein n=1 Tax=Clostridium sp. TaxID=1506 RepID=UPI003D6D8EF2